MRVALRLLLRKSSGNPRLAVKRPAHELNNQTQRGTSLIAVAGHSSSSARPPSFERVTDLIRSRAF